MIKRLTKTTIGKSILSPVIATVIKLLSLSIKWKILNEENKLKNISGDIAKEKSVLRSLSLLEELEMVEKVNNIIRIEEIAE